MKINTMTCPSHLANYSSITRSGRIMRKMKLDELPQLFNVLKGNMSLVGPRPIIFDQQDVIEERDKRGIYNYLPGITGMAPVNGIDTSTPEKLARVDALMLRNLNVFTYFKYIFATVLGRGKGDRVKKNQNIQQEILVLQNHSRHIVNM